MRRAAALIASLFALAVVPAVVAGPPSKEQVRLNPADQAAARAAVLRLRDLGSSGWSGGAQRPNLAAAMSCAGYTPKQSDLVLTGAAETRFSRAGLAVQSVAQVLKTRAMVGRDWQRTVVEPRSFACLRTMLARSLRPGQRLVSFTKLAFPQLARFTAAYRALVDVAGGGAHVRVVADIVLVAKSRTEVTLSVEGPAAAKATLHSAELRLARLLLARASA
jgi:hypothetical protein